MNRGAGLTLAPLSRKLVLPTTEERIMDRPKGYSVGITEVRKLYGNYRRPGTWPDGTTQYRVTVKNPAGKTMTFPYFHGPAITRTPTAGEVVGAAISDGMFWEQYPDFEEFCLETDQEPDSKEAKASYDACKSMSERTREIFGDDFDDWCEYSAE
ncbi:Hypothetical Protein OBI_RACECAR_307 [Arthrobacter phage Racecar]|nr:hypothetical protein PBI_RACECAR_99 [Arthrobacter phage Racecar]